MFYPKLKKGATIGIVAPSSAIKEERITKGIAKLESLGYKVVLSDACGKTTFNGLSGDDDLRVRGINQMFARKDIDAIICQNGGYGSPRIVDRLDYEMIKKNPKVFCGFSDITLLLNSITEKCNFVTYHGPMLTVDFASKFQEVSISSFLDLVTKNEELVINKSNEFNIDVIHEGKSKGILVGGNLSLLDVLVSSEYVFNPIGKILFIEDVGEKNYRLDRMMQSLRLRGILDKVSGIIIGGITGDKTPQEGSLELFKNILGNYDYPIMFNLPIGHVTPRYTVPIGGMVEMDTKTKTLRILKEE